LKKIHLTPGQFQEELKNLSHDEGLKRSDSSGQNNNENPIEQVYASQSAKDELSSIKKMTMRKRKRDLVSSTVSKLFDAFLGFYKVIL